MKILIADDDPVARRVLESAIGDMGHEVVVVNDGREAWQHLRSQRVDVLISDWVMPHIDGLELSRRLRARTDEPFTYVMLVTARERSRRRRVRDHGRRERLPQEALGACRAARPPARR